MEDTQLGNDEQQEVIAFLLRPESYGCPSGQVTRIDTHISVIFLVDDHAYKMKRAVNFAYLDYSTLERRQQLCEAELAVNCRTAPEIYRNVLPVTRELDGTLKLDGEGEPVEWLVSMNRFDQDTLFDRMAVSDRLTPKLMTDLADSIAEFHKSAATDISRKGSAAMRWVVDGNNHEIHQRTPKLFDASRTAFLETRSQEMLDDVSALLDRRSDQGHLRHCHGDLHLRNICLFEGRPTLFDGVEFNEAITSIDVLYDVAFLLMDLEHRGHRDLGNVVFNRYLAMSEELDGLTAMPLFLACRAAIRAHTTAAAAEAQTNPESVRVLEVEACAYLDLACEYLIPKPPRLIAVGGLSGTGKSTLGRQLASLVGRSPGALILRSDVIRKRLFGVAPEAELDAVAYTKEQSLRVYARLQQDAAAALAAGQSVIVDAVFAHAEERIAIDKIAREASVLGTGLWLEAPKELLQARVTARTGDASDADAAVVAQQFTYDTGSLDWHRVDASGDAQTTLDAAKRLVL